MLSWLCDYAKFLNTLVAVYIALKQAHLFHNLGSEVSSSKILFFSLIMVLGLEESHLNFIEMQLCLLCYKNLLQASLRIDLNSQSYFLVLNILLLFRRFPSFGKCLFLSVVHYLTRFCYHWNFWAVSWVLLFYNFIHFMGIKLSPRCQALRIWAHKVES